MNYAMRSFIGFSFLPLTITIYLGLFLVMASFIFILYNVMKFVLFGASISDSVTAVFLITFFGGLQFLAISVIGKYIQVIVEETKNRPMYITESTVNR